MPTQVSTSVRPMHPEDWPDVERILRLGLASGSASLETTPPTWERWDAEHLTAHRWVAMSGTEIAGWSALGFPHRTVAAGVAESSVYVDAAHRRCGIGSVLLLKLIDESERAGLWTIEARILETNVASLRLHSAFGFRVVGVRERIGLLHEEWRNVLLLERRSTTVGC